MVIKYSQLDMVENMYYPVAVILSSALLLAALGVLLKLSPEPVAINNIANIVLLKPIDNLDGGNGSIYICIQLVCRYQN